MPVVYLSLGTVCRWTEWEVKAFYDGLKDLNVRVVWTIKEKELVDQLFEQEIRKN